MPGVPKKIRLSLFQLILFSVVIITGCSYRQPHLQPFPVSKDKMAVIGFRAALAEGQKEALVRSPLSGAVFMAEHVPASIINHMNDILFNLLIKKENYNLISPDQVEGAFASIISSEKYDLDDIAVIQKIGKAFTADTVLVGYLYRWQDREGTEYSAKQPASVAFDLYLIKSETGDILWKGSFDKTQRSLMENLLDFSFFFKGRGKWMTVHQMADLGLSEMIDSNNTGSQH